MSIARYFNPRLRARLLDGDVPDWLQNHVRRQYITAAVLASPAWGNAAAIRVLRDVARARTIATGIPHVLDHEIPLNHKYVCGLHVAENLRVVPYSVNARKGNRWSPDQMELPL